MLAWNQAIDEIKSEDKIYQMKKSSFDDLNKAFKNNNRITELKSESEFKEILEMVEQKYTYN